MTARALPPTAFGYVDCEVPAGHTLTQWRREREAQRRTPRWLALLRPKAGRAQPH